jgi:acetate kinase
MQSDPQCVLAVNAGSSSIRFAMYEVANPLRARLDGQIERIGLAAPVLTVNDSARPAPTRVAVDAGDQQTAAAVLVDWLEAQALFGTIKAVGHRVVHGMGRSEPEQITSQLLADLHRITAYDPEHLPVEIRLIELFLRRQPALPQVACFDTAFHHTMPTVATLLPIPRRYAGQGVKRYGFHGLSYSYLMEQLGRLDPAAARGRVILAHLGNGASLAAVRNGKSIDTSMGFTPTSGLVMSTRTGDLDPGVMDYISRTDHMDASRLQHMVTHESGLLGVSETSPDMQDLLAREAADGRAADAIALFCYQAKKWIGSFAAVLGGVDTIVFAGGIGENAPVIRARICEGLGFLGIDVHPSRNAATEDVISTDAGRVTIRVIRTDEAMMIARAVVRTCPQLLSPGMEHDAH